MFAETEREASFRRNEVRRTNAFKFVERLATLIVALVAVLCGIAASVYCAHIGQTTVAVTFATTTIGALAYAFISATKGVTEQPRQAKRSR